MTITLYSHKQVYLRTRSVYTELKKQLNVYKQIKVIEEIGSSAIEGAISKGDLDIAVYVEETDFQEVCGRLMLQYERNDMEGYKNFESFKGMRNGVDFGIQLCTFGWDHFRFLEFKKIMQTSPSWVESYNKLKYQASTLAEDEYRSKKHEFIESVLQRSDSIDHSDH